MSRRACLAAALALLALGPAHAHRPSDAFLTLEVNGRDIAGHWEIALRDLAVAVPVDGDGDGDGDGTLTWGELRRAQPLLAGIATGALELSSAGRRCPVELADLLVNERIDGPYAWLAVRARCPAPPATLDIGYRFLSGIDPTHRGILALAHGGVVQSAVLAPAADIARLALARPSALRQFLDYFREGAHHIWIGLDHVLFLLVLLLPCVLERRGGAWDGAPRLGRAMWEVVRVVTAFTLAHSVTLSLAALGWVRLPPAPVEALIALTVLLAALNNVRPVVVRARSAVTFAFGLLHGFGFASVLGELGLPAEARVLALAGFNLGVEAGQLAIVAAAVPLVFALRETRLYRHAVMPGGSLAAAAIAGFWLLQRTGVIDAWNPRLQ